MRYTTAKSRTSFHMSFAWLRTLTLLSLSLYLLPSVLVSRFTPFFSPPTLSLLFVVLSSLNHLLVLCFLFSIFLFSPSSFSLSLHLSLSCWAPALHIHNLSVFIACPLWLWLSSSSSSSSLSLSPHLFLSINLSALPYSAQPSTPTFNVYLSFSRLRSSFAPTLLKKLFRYIISCP